MQRIIQINIAGRIIPIEEDAYLQLKDYMNALDRHFASEEGKDEIMQDIEFRVAELFGIRLNSGTPAIDKGDVQKVIETLGQPGDIHEEGTSSSAGSTKGAYTSSSQKQYTYQQQYQYTGERRLYRNPNDKILGGVCSGIASYFDIDPTIVRLIFALLLFGLGIGFIAYIIAWIIVPVARTPEQLRAMYGGEPITFHTMTQNMGQDLQDMKHRAEEMSKELKDFFSKKK